MEDEVYALIIGPAVYNCIGTLPVAINTGGSITVADAWSTSESVGFDLGDLKIGETASWTRSTAQTFVQTITLTVDAGFMVHFISTVLI
jgi:hypothetical protein